MDNNNRFLQPREDETIICSPAASILRKAKSELRASVTVISGPRTGLMFFIKLNSGVTLGRSADADIQIIDAGVSRRHIHMYLVDDKVYVEDLHSANGTYFDGERLSGVMEITNGDQISIGVSTVLKFNLNNRLDTDYQKQILINNV